MRPSRRNLWSILNRGNIFFSIFTSFISCSRKKKNLTNVKAIKEAEPLRNPKELNSFLCTVQYKAQFTVSYTPQTDTLRDLLKADVFTWKKEHRDAFNSLKEAAFRHRPGLFRTQRTA